MASDKLRAYIRECIKKELEETSTSGAAGAYMTPNAFEKREKKDKNPFVASAFGKGKHEKDPYDADIKKKKKPVDEAAGQPLTKTVKDRAENCYHELVDKKVETDENKKDHQSAKEAHKKVPFGDGNVKKLPEHVEFAVEEVSPTKQIGISVREIHNHVNKLRESLKLANSIKTENNLGSTNLWKRTMKQVTKTEAAINEILRELRELKS